MLIILLNTINKAKQKVSLRSISKEYKLRWSTLLESLSSLEEKEIIKANHKKDGTIIDLSEFLTGTLSVPVNMYVCSMLNIINNTNNKQTDGTESVPVRASYEKRILESNIRIILGILEMLEITIDGRNNKSGFSRMIASIIKENSTEERKIENLLAMAAKTKNSAKTNKSGYFVKLCREMDPDEITEEMLKEVSGVKKVYQAVCNKEFDDPSLDELKKYAGYFGSIHHLRNREDLVDYLSVKADFIKDKVNSRIERMKEWGII